MARRKPFGADVGDEEQEPQSGRRRRRSAEELIADLEQKIELIKRRAATKSLAKSPAMKAAIKAVKAIDKCLAEAENEQDTALRHALADARDPLVHHLQSQGISLERTRRPKGPRPK